MDIRKKPQPPYQHQAYPKFLYSLAGAERLVTSAVEHAQLGPDWFESPAEARAAASGEPLPVPATPGPIVVEVAKPCQHSIAELEALLVAAKADAAEKDAAERVELERQQAFALAQAEAKIIAERERVSTQEHELVEMQAVHEAPVSDLVRTLQGSGLDTLKRLRAIETANPKGARKSLIEAIDKQVAKLVPVPPQE